MPNQWKYSRKLKPPFPVVEATLFKPWSEDSAAITETLQVDSGADITGIPLTVIDRLGTRLVGWGEAFDFNNNLVIDVPIYEMGIEIAGVRFKSIEVFGLDSDLGFIGRVLLNSFLVTLDGPAHMTFI